MMPPSAGVAYLLRPLALASWNQIRRRPLAGALATLQVGGVALLVWWLVSAMTSRGLRAFRHQPEIADLLLGKLLGIAILVGVLLAIVATTVGAIGICFRAKDLPLLLAAPVDWLRVHLAQLLLVGGQGAWAIVLLLGPVLAVVGQGPGAHWPYLLTVLAGGGALLILAASTGMALALGMVRLAGARRARGVGLALGALVLLAGGGVLRAASPASLVRISSYGSSLALVEALSQQGPAWAPSTWWTQALLQARPRPGVPPVVDWLALGALIGAMAITVTMTAALYGWGYRHAIGRGGARDGASPRTRRQREVPRLVRWLARHTGWPAAHLVWKDLTRLTRTASEWSHASLALLGLALFFYNLATLPLTGTDATTRLFAHALAMLSLGVGGLIFGSIAAHYVLPSVSLEGANLWLLRASPLAWRTVLRVKWTVGAALIVPASVGTSLVATAILGSPWAFRALAATGAAGLAIGIVSLAVWLGARAPRFQATSAARVVASAPGTLFIFLVMALAVATMMAVAPAGFAMLGADGGRLPPGVEALMAMRPLARWALAVLGLAGPAHLGLWLLKRAPAALEAQLAALGGNGHGCA